MSVSDDEAAEAAWLPELDFPLSEAALDQGIANTAKQIFHLAKQGKAISLYAVLAERVRKRVVGNYFEFAEKGWRRFKRSNLFALFNLIFLMNSEISWQ